MEDAVDVAETVGQYTDKQGRLHTIHPQVVTYSAGLEMVHLLNDPQHGKDVCTVFVTFDASNRQNDPFWQGVEHATAAHGGYLNDGRNPASIITFWPNHDTHFHWRFC